MDGYEKECVSEYVYKNVGKLVLSRPDHDSTRKSFSYKEEQVVQPFNELNLGIKQKMLDLKAYSSALESLEGLVEERLRAIERRVATEARLAKARDKLGQTRDADTLEAELSALYKEVENLTAIINIAVTYMTDIFLPVFKRRQLMMFYHILERFVNSRASHFSNVAQAWTALLGDKNLKHF